MGFIDTFANGALKLKIREIINALVASANGTGWAEYTDTEFTEENPLAIAGGAEIAIPCNAGKVRDFEKPQDIATFYDAAGGKVTGRDGDGLLLVTEIKLKPTSGSATLAEVWVDIGTPEAPIKLYPDFWDFPKGPGEERPISFSVPGGFTLDTWEANGARVMMKVNGPCEAYGFRHIVTRTHKSRNGSANA